MDIDVIEEKKDFKEIMYMYDVENRHEARARTTKIMNTINVLGGNAVEYCKGRAADAREKSKWQQ